MSMLSQSVGLSIRTLPSDVKYVQFLLNEWHRNRAMKPLKIDGIVGPLTDAAIRQFQQIETGLVDGQVDRNGPSIRRLEYLHIAGLMSKLYYQNINPAHRVFTSNDVHQYACLYLTALRKRFA